VVNTGALGFGSLLTAMGFGSLIAALSMAYMARPSERVLVAAATGFCVLLAALAVSSIYVLTIGILVIMGFIGISFTATANSRLQLSAPPELRGRVMSLYIFLNMGTAPLGTFLIGWLASRFSVEVSILSMAGICAAGVALGLYYRSRHPGATSPLTEPVASRG
ncbi:MAG: MFS transporter, partial [Nitrolancea sp.]